MRLTGAPVGSTESYTFTSRFACDGEKITATVERTDDPAYNNISDFVRQGAEIVVGNNRGNDTEVFPIDSRLRSTEYAYNGRGNVTNYNGSQEYDDKNRVLRHVNMPSWYFTKSNILRRIST